MSKEIKNFITWVRSFLDDIYQNKLISGTNIKTINNNSLLGSGNINIEGGSAKNVFYGNCSTSAGTQTKIVSVTGWTWTSGNVLFVSFVSGNTYSNVSKISIDGTSKDIIAPPASSTPYYWKDGEVVCFIYNGTNFVIVEQGIADKNYYGMTRFTDIINLIYPVGAIYMSVNSTSPATLFGGTWVQLTDTFLYASNTADTNSTTATNGSANAVIVAHSHTPVTDSSGANAFAQVKLGAFYHDTGNNRLGTVNSNGVRYAHVGQTNNPTASHSSTAEAGVDGTGKNMPPYMKVFMWKRTA